MKKSFLFFILLLVNFISAQNHQVHINYNLKLDNKSNSSSTELSRAFESQKFKLFASRSQSLFFGIKKISNEITKAEKIASIYTRSNDKFYIDSKKTILEKEVSGKIYLIEKKRNFIKWKITKENRKIGNYICFKATGVLSKKNYKDEKVKTDIIAWYCPEINYSIGPLGYDGLPGAILELQIAKIKYYATKVIFVKEDLEKIKEPSKGERMTEDEFEEFNKKKYQDRKS
ncbi:GLPGLI family protein [uncultured Lacinutrix sp.]|uniref:GLPGLI family protein n=1 Tax=uncultured Lacinutrix sp. TaxID=574032 RepID=UPI002608C1E4|nr:GLPGLI family protein [uncultured Lacinutrix sp.]